MLGLERGAARRDASASYHLSVLLRLHGSEPGQRIAASDDPTATRQRPAAAHNSIRITAANHIAAQTSVPTPFTLLQVLRQPRALPSSWHSQTLINERPFVARSLRLNSPSMLAQLVERGCNGDITEHVHGRCGSAMRGMQ